MTTTNSWTGGTSSTDFSNGANWSTGTAPGTDREDVYIQNFDDNFQSQDEWSVVDATNTSLDSLTLWGGVDFTEYGGTLGYLNILEYAEFEIGSSTPGANTTTVEVDGGNILNDGRLIVHSGSSLLIGDGQENYNNSDTELYHGMTTLSGSGDLVLDGGTISSGNGFSNLIIGGTTIEGNGSIGGGTSVFILIINQHSLIQAQDGTLLIDPDHNNNNAGVYNLGTIEATSGSVIDLKGSVESADDAGRVSISGFGSLVADDSSTIFLSSFVSEQDMTDSGSGLFEIGDSAGDTVSAALYEDIVEGTVAVERNATLHFGKDGTVIYDPTYEIDQGDVYVSGAVSVYGGSIVIDSSVTLLGAEVLAGPKAGTVYIGTLNLSAGGAAATITATTSVTLTNDIVIEGQGTIGDGNNLLLVNQGTIDADLAGTVLTVNLVDDEGTSAATGTNSGLMEATHGGSLAIQSADHADAIFTNTGTIEAFAGSGVGMSQLALTNITGGVLTGGIWEASGNGSDISFDPDYTFTSDAATLILNGAGSVIDEGGPTLESELTDIAKSGTLEVLGSRAYTTSNALTFEGKLQLGGGTFKSGAITGTSGSSLTGFGTYASAIKTSGGVTATGGTLTFTGKDSFSGALAGTGGIMLSKDAVTLGTGASLAARSLTLSSATLSLGTSLIYAATFAGTTTKTLFSETASAMSFMSSGLSLTLAGAATLAGGSVSGGTLNLKGAATSSGFSVIGGGTLAVGGSLTLTNAALTLGNKPASGTATSGTTTIKAGGVLDLVGTASIGVAAGATGTFTNAGMLEKLDNGGIAKVTAAITNTGTILVANGTLDMTGAVSGAGKATIEIGGTLEFDAAATGAVSFGASGGTLKLGAAASFKGSVGSLGAGDTIDVGGFGKGTTFTYTANAQKTGGTLKLTDGSKTTSLTLAGSYVTGGFHLTNGSTDTAITYTAAAAPKVASHAHALTAALFEAAFAPTSSGTAFDHAASPHADAAIFAADAHAGSALPAHAMWG